VDNSFNATVPKDQIEFASNKMRVYLFLVRNYFISVVESLELLRLRIQSVERDVFELVRHLPVSGRLALFSRCLKCLTLCCCVRPPPVQTGLQKRKISEFEGFGMTIELYDMVKCLASNEGALVNDSALCNRLRKGASDAFDILVSLLGQHFSIFGGSEHSLSSPHSTLLQTLYESISKLAIPNGLKRLEKVSFVVGVASRVHGTLGYHSENSSTNPKLLLGTSRLSQAVCYPSPGTATPNSSDEQEASVIHRFSWAIKNENAILVLQKKKSLLDIQMEEEMQSRLITEQRSADT
jgi:hypothetical protein